MRRLYAGKTKTANLSLPDTSHVFVDTKELDRINQKIAQLGTANMRADFRKMEVGGYVVNLEMPELGKLPSKMKRISNSENQVANQLNTIGNIHEADIEENKKKQAEQA